MTFCLLRCPLPTTSPSFTHIPSPLHTPFSYIRDTASTCDSHHNHWCEMMSYWILITTVVYGMQYTHTSCKYTTCYVQLLHVVQDVDVYMYMLMRVCVFVCLWWKPELSFWSAFMPSLGCACEWTLPWHPPHMTTTLYLLAGCPCTQYRYLYLFRKPSI